MSARVWCFTSYDNFRPIAENDIRYTCYQLEKCPQTGREHIQGFIQFNKKMRLSALKKINATAHWEKSRGNFKQNYAYCTKEDSRIDGPWEYGESVTQGSRTDISEMVQRIKKRELSAEDVEEEYANLFAKYYTFTKSLLTKYDRAEDNETERGIWIYGESRAGKTLAAHQMAPDAYLKSCNKWWDGYIGQKFVIMEDIDKKHDILGHHLKIWADWRACQGEVKGGTVPLKHKYFIVTSQYSIDDIWNDQETRDALKNRFIECRKIRDIPIETKNFIRKPKRLKIQITQTIEDGEKIYEQTKVGENQ